MSTKIRERHAVKSYGLRINLRNINQDNRKAIGSYGPRFNLGYVNQDHRKPCSKVIGMGLGST